MDKSRIHCEYGGTTTVLYMDADEARGALESAGVVIRERVLSADGNRIWTLTQGKVPAMRQVKLNREYRGCIITRSTRPGYRLPWTAMTGNRQVAAETLADIKELIRETVRTNKKKMNG